MEQVLRKYTGLPLASAEIVDNVLHLRFMTGHGLRLWDDGQSCCESRYMRTDDTVEPGAVFLGVEMASAPNVEDDEVHEVQFLNVLTSAGAVQYVNHNEHNGYYGGFSVAADEVAWVRPEGYEHGGGIS